MPDAGTFAARLRSLRESAGLTQAALAERAGLHLMTLAKLEQGQRRRPSWETVQALARGLGVSTEAFREGGPDSRTP